MESKSKYYIVETCKILTSQNFHFLSLTNDETPPEPIAITPDAPGEGKSEESTQPTSGNKSENIPKRKNHKTRDIPEVYKLTTDIFTIPFPMRKTKQMQYLPHQMRKPSP
jgi:hypothetical protein